ncbi:MAG TPA: prolyl oligopeptidase family serine peptidase [Candidatus Elarobacter sp.]|nr:prolyl oligopeptidase family serine peptidase [Candidatus Elarobacter sp.]
MSAVRRALAACGALALALPGAPARAQSPAYERAPEAMRRILDAAPAPEVYGYANGAGISLVWPERVSSIALQSRPSLRLAGLRIDPRSNALRRAPTFSRIALQRIDAAAPFFALASTPARRLALLRVNARGTRAAIELIGDDGVRLMIADLGTRRTAVVPGLRLNPVLAEPFTWMPDGAHLLVHAALGGAPPVRASVPSGPVVEESSGGAAPERTHQDLLRDAGDEAAFEHYAASRLAYVDAATLRVAAFGPSAPIEQVRVAPDGRYLLIDVLHRPYRHDVSAAGFPRRTEIRDARGALVRVLADNGGTGALPGGAVADGPRNVKWRPNEPATLDWLDALDGGAPFAMFQARDAIESLAAPFRGAPREVVRSEKRLMTIVRVDGSPVELVADYDPATRERTTYALDASAPRAALRPLWTHRDGSRYDDPGLFASKRTANGEVVAYQAGGAVFLFGEGIAREGSRPFVDRLDLRTLERRRIFRSELQPLETPVAVLDAQGARLVLARSSRTEPMNVVVRDGARERALTAFADPAPELRGIVRRFVSYKRSDGVDCSFTLYLPPGYREGTKLPTLLWAYPREYANAGLAGQISDDAQSLWTPRGFAPLMALAGYAVLDDVATPVVGDPRTANDNYLRQVTDDAESAIREAVALGVTDPDRVAVGGYSYGAAMAANLLAHTQLFRAGIAMSGAYNRTLTPFGFQNETRTYWQAPQAYASLSAFDAADRIADPLLLIHGADDDNDGTFPMQSERMFAALRGNGRVARLVMLPHEEHEYAARESLETVVAEMVNWLDRFVKAAKPRPS